MREGIVAPPRLQIWEKPGLGTVKLNFDGALDLKTGGVDQNELGLCLGVLAVQGRRF